eukprot:211552_1
MCDPSLRLGELGDGLGALAHGVAGELGGEHEADGGLHLAGAESLLAVDAGQLGGLGGEALEDIVHEGVDDLLGAAAQGHLGVDALEGAAGVDVPGALALAGDLGGLAGNFLGDRLLSGGHGGDFSQ